MIRKLLLLILLIPMMAFAQYGGIGGSNGSSGPVTINNYGSGLAVGYYDPTNATYAGGINGATPAAAFQAVSDQMACDLARGIVQEAIVNVPAGTYTVDDLYLAPGSVWEGAPNALAGTTLQQRYNGHWLAKMQTPYTPAGNCSDGLSHTDSVGGGTFEHFSIHGCDTGSCTNAPGDTTSYQFGGPGNTGLDMGNSVGLVQWVDAEAFGGYGIRIDGQDARGFHNRAGSISANLGYYLYGTYKGVSEGTATSEFSGNVASGSTGSVALTWTASASATGYVVYRGSTSGNENAWYLTSTNSFTDTCAATNSGGIGTAQITNALLAPTTPAAVGAITGGTCAAGTYYYIVTPTKADGWHGTMELVATDGYYDFMEPYGAQTGVTQFTYHHLADILLDGGGVTLSHAFPQWGHVGIMVGPSGGNNERIIDPRVDFANLEGILVADGNVSIYGGVVNGCMASNAVALNGGGVCDQLSGNYQGSNATDLNIWGTQFEIYGGFGANYATGDYLVTSGTVQPGSTYYGAELYGGNSGGTGQGRAFGGSNFFAQNSWVFQTTGSVPNVQGQVNIQPNDSSATNITGFARLMAGQPLYILGGNANDTLVNGTFLKTCNGQNVNLGNFPAQYLLFYTSTYNGNGATTPLTVEEVCPDSISHGVTIQDEAQNLNGDYFVDGNSVASCTVNGTAYTTNGDCAFQAAKYWATQHSNLNATVHFGSEGIISTALGFQMPTAAGNNATVNLIGDGPNASYVKLTGSLGTTCMITQPAETTVGDSAYQHIEGLTLDLNSNSQCGLQIYGVKSSRYASIRIINVQTSTAGSGGAPVQFANTTQATQVFDTTLEDISVDSGGAGGYTAAGFTCTNLSSPGNPVCSVSSAGSFPSNTGNYVETWGTGNGSGACSVYPTWTVTYAGSGPYTVTGLTASGGTCLGTVYPSLEPAPQADYVFKFLNEFTDNDLSYLRAVMPTNYATMIIKGHPNIIKHYHPYSGQPVGMEDYGGDIYIGTECDTMGGFCMAEEGIGTVMVQTSSLFNNFTGNQGGALFYVDTSVTTTPTFNSIGVTCNGNRQTRGGYSKLVLGSGLPYNNTSTTGGAIENGTAIPSPAISLENTLDCGTSPTTNTFYSHIGTMGLQYGGVLGPATAPSGTCAASFGGQHVFSQDGHDTFCPSGGGTWTSKF